jgi:protein O-mannosyl-transferase
LANAKGLFLFKASVRSTAIAVLVILVGFALLGVYWPGLHGHFFFDDLPNILTVESVKLKTLSVESLTVVVGSGHSGASGRPVAQLSFALNHYFSGLDPFAFKLTNLAIHLANGVLIFMLARRLFASLRVSTEQRRALIAAGLLATAWLLHPIQLLPVLHVVQRMTSLSAFFLLMALLCHMRGREVDAPRSVGWLLLGWGIFWPLSFLSKETGLLFPFFALALELIVRRAAGGGLDSFARMFALLAGAVLALVVGYLLSPLGDWLWAGYGLRSFSLVERLLTEGRVLWFYLGLILFPRLEEFGLFHDDFTLSTGILSPWTTLPALAGLLGLAWLVWRLRARLPLVSFGIAWFLVGHGLESTFLPLEIAHEHRNYLPLFGILLAVVSVLVRTLEKPGPGKTFGIALMATMLAYFPFVTALRADQFGDEVRRSQIEAQHHRASARAQHEAGRVLAGLEGSDSASSPRYSLARRHYELAGQLDPNSKMHLLGLIHLNCQAGISVEQPWIVELQRRLRDTPFAPGDRTVLYSLKEMTVAGSVCLGRSDVDGLFAAAIANPGVSPGVRAMLYSWHADYLWLHQKDLPAAFAALGQSLTLVPSNASNRLKFAQLRFMAGEREQAGQLLLELRGERLSMEERKTLDELLAGLGMLESKSASEKLDQ